MKSITTFRLMCEYFVILLIDQATLVIPFKSVLSQLLWKCYCYRFHLEGLLQCFLITSLFGFTWGRQKFPPIPPLFYGTWDVGLLIMYSCKLIYFVQDHSWPINICLLKLKMWSCICIGLDGGIFYSGNLNPKNNLYISDNSVVKKCPLKLVCCNVCHMLCER